MPLKQNKPSKIHHSDRGSQYTCIDYLDILKEQGVKVSIALTAQDSAYAERINRTIKEEYLDYWRPNSFNQLKTMMNRAVENYNKIRPYRHLKRNSPYQFELNY